MFVFVLLLISFNKSFHVVFVTCIYLQSNCNRFCYCRVFFMSPNAFYGYGQYSEVKKTTNEWWERIGRIDDFPGEWRDKNKHKYVTIPIHFMYQLKYEIILRNDEPFKALNKNISFAFFIIDFYQLNFEKCVFQLRIGLIAKQRNCSKQVHRIGRKHLKPWSN